MSTPSPTLLVAASSSITPAPVPEAPRPVAPLSRMTAAPTPTNAQDPLIPRETANLTIDTKRDEITSGLSANSNSVNGELFLKQGITISGTHYGLNLISTSGVVHIAKGARILPSKERTSRIIAKKIVIAGEIVIDQLQADELLVLTADAQCIIGEVQYGQSLVTSDGAQWRITRGIRQLTARERRATHWYDASMASLADSDAGFEAFCIAQDAEIESTSDSLVPEHGRGASLAAVAVR